MTTFVWRTVLWIRSRQVRGSKEQERDVRWTRTGGEGEETAGEGGGRSGI